MSAFISARLSASSGPPSYPLGSAAAAARERVERKIRDGSYPFEDVPCFCGASDDAPFSGLDRFGLRHPQVACRACGIIRAHPRMTAAAYADFYQNEYRALYGDEDSGRDAKFTEKLAAGRALYSSLAGTLGPKKGVFLDVGCNMGAAAAAFAEKGWEAYGVDHGGDYVEFGRRKTGLSTLMRGGVEKFAALGKKADLVVVDHVLEHFLDLRGELEGIRSVLAPGGRVHVSVPGTFWWIENVCGGNLLMLLQNAHVWQFSLASLTYVMARCGFRRLSGDERATALFEAGTSGAGEAPPAGEWERVTSYCRRLERRYFPKHAAKAVLRAFGLRR